MLPDVYSLTMAAGASSRMPVDLRPKACCKVGSQTVVENALSTYEQAGIFKHVMVVGQYAERIMTQLGHRRDVLFAYQSQAKGTGDAVRCGLDLLANIGAPEHILISAGDKVIAPQVIRGLVEAFLASGDDLRLVAGRSSDFPGSGRIVVRDGKAVAIVEVPDIKVRTLAARLRRMPEAERPKTAGDLSRLASEYVKPEKLAAYFPGLSALLAGGPGHALDWGRVLAAAQAVPEGFDLPGGPVTLEEAAAAPLCNLSVYVGRFEAIRDAVEKLRSDNVQKEWYLTDIIQILAAKGDRVGLFRTRNAEEVMAFNTVEELEDVRRVYARGSAHAARYPTVEKWKNHLEWIGEKGFAAQAVELLGKQVGGEKPCIIVRSPGRINLMGRHIDHQGGRCNLMAIDREIVLAAAPRDDERINLWNASAKDYPYRTFTFNELTAEIEWDDWMRTLNTQFVQRYVAKNAGDWVNYVKGAALRLQHRYSDRRLRGMDAYVCGNIPAAAGLSSSSALVVAAAEALVELNALNIGVRDFIDLCGEGEWFVGTRGGSADHAAIKYSRANEVVTVSFFPFEVIAHYPFPKECSLLVCNSGVSAKKTENARARFNSRVACYHMAREVIKKKFPHFAPLIEHLRDVNTRRLDISLPALYELLRQLPNQIGRAEIEELAARHPTVAKCVSGFNLAEQEYPLRDVALYGLAECERALRTAELLQRGDAAALGKMMNLSHDGDRVVKWAPDQQPFENSASDERMATLVRQSSALQPLAGANAALWQQPGAYDCSTPEIDRMVDIVNQVPGVFGSQLAGAGLGGCIMVLVRREAAERAQEALKRGYYDPLGLEPIMFVCQPSRGSQVLTTVEAER